MKSKITIISVVALIFATLIFTGCSNNQTKEIDETMKVGVIIPLTGNDASIGNYSKEGIQLAVENLNNNGGVNGKKLELDIQDSKSEPKTGLSIIKGMVESNKKPFLVYTIISGVTMQLKPITEENKIILFSSVGTDNFLKNSKYTIRNYYSASQIADVMTNYLLESLKKNELSIFYANTEYGNNVKDAMIHFSHDRGIKNNFIEAFTQTDVDFKSIIASKINTETKCIYVVGVGRGLGTMIKQIRENGYKGLIIEDPLVTDPNVIQILGDDKNGIYYLNYSFNKENDNPKMSNFINEYKTKFNRVPDNFAKINYEGFNIVFQAIKQNRNFNADSLINTINTYKNFPGEFEAVSVIENHVKYPLSVFKY